MGVQFGKCHFDGKSVDPKDLDDVRPVLAPYGPDGEGYICKGNLAILYRAFHTTKESRHEVQPYVSASGFVLTWDGRLDNREEFIGGMIGEVRWDATDLEIVAAAYERWGTNAFGKLIGDWALSVWDSRDHSIILAKDFVGIRHLYYTVGKDTVTWCTILDPLVLFGDRPFKLQEEYVAGWLAFFPASPLTPYVGIHAVPPSSFIRLTQETQRVCNYWDFDPEKRVRYSSDRDYEEHFRLVFSESVSRRLRANGAVLAELSGGMDSPSIVCMADEIMAKGRADCPRLDTVSIFNDSEPNWDERPYVARVEEKRGRIGCHLDVGSESAFCLEVDDRWFAATPGSLRFRDSVQTQFAECALSQGANRVVLSGTGGDEVTGGVPTPLPELEDLLSEARVAMLCHQLKVWALSKRKPWLHLLWHTARRFFPGVNNVAGHRSTPWLDAGFTKRHGRALQGYPRRVKLLGPKPSFQENISTLAALRRQLSCEPVAVEPCYEVRYPFLDRRLLEFLYAVPREQLVRPAQRRSLMRRALIGIVPDELLNRKRKAYVERGMMSRIGSNWEYLFECQPTLELRRLGIVDQGQLHDAVRIASRGLQVPIVILMRTLGVELWLRMLRGRGVLREPHSVVENRLRPHCLESAQGKEGIGSPAMPMKTPNERR